MKNNKIYTVILFVFCQVFAFAQEGIAPLAGNEALMWSSGTTYKREANPNYTYEFAFNTNHLPIVDDFSINRFKQYTIDPNIPTTMFVWNTYLMNGVYEEVFNAMLDTTFVFTYDSITEEWDSVATPVVHIIEYSLTDYQMPVDTDTVWARQDTLIRNDSIIENHSTDRVYQNASDTVVLVSDVGYTIWRNNNALHNYSYSKEAPTLGMVTFDGLDSTGIPYDPTMNANSYQIADILESKPIYLKTRPLGGSDYNYLVDSIYLSFQYQPQGLGDAPEPEDSLVLEFYSPFTDTWYHMWSVAGDTVRPFQSVMVKISNPLFFLDGFKFRFLNYASVSGNFDHWNVDYVRLDENRFAGDSTIQDVGLMDPGYSLLENYYQMPWKHYKAGTKDFMKTEQFIRYKNQGSLSYTAISEFSVFDDVTLLFSGTQGIDPQFGPLEVGGQTSLFSGTYPKTSTDSIKTFNVEYLAEVNPDNNHDNDRYVFKQQFGSQYAYDDGSAEGAYYVKSSGAQIAVEYEIAVLDSLRAINIYFPRSFTSITDRPYRLMVWKSLNPEVILYEGYLETPIYAGGRDLVQGILLEEPIEVEGIIYVGIKQLDDIVYIGMDRTNDSQSKNFYNVSGTWNASEFPGSIFIRPEFGTTDPFPVSVASFEVADDGFNVYPNPANNQVTIESTTENNLIIVRNILGVVVRNFEASYYGTFDASDLPTGLYVVEKMDLYTQKSSIKKLLIQH